MMMLEKAIKLNLVIMGLLSVTACSSLPEVVKQVGDYASREIQREFNIDRRHTRPIFAGLAENLEIYLNEREKQQQLKATQLSLSTDQVGIASQQTWQSKQRSGVSGSSQVASQYVAKNGLTCRITKHMTTGPKGQSVSTDQHWCKQGDGRWVPVV